MTYIQKDFEAQIKDITPGRSSLIISFANLLDRFGKSVSPITLEASLQDDGMGEVSLGSVSLYDKNVQISSFGQSGQPLRDDAIMRFEYFSPATGSIVTHYCLVKDAASGTIIDSYSGVEKNWSVYGGPGAWAVYTNNEPVAASEPIPVNNSDETNNEPIEDNTAYIEAITAPEMTSQPDVPELPADDSVVIPVKHKIVDPLSWQATYRPGLGVLDTTSIKDVIITDLSEENPDRQLDSGTKVPVAGRFVKDGITYYRTVKSVEAGIWYGIPAGVLIQSSKLTEDDDINEIFNSPDETAKDKVIKTAATIEGKTKKLFRFGRK